MAQVVEKFNMTVRIWINKRLIYLLMYGWQGTFGLSADTHLCRQVLRANWLLPLLLVTQYTANCCQSIFFEQIYSSLLSIFSRTNIQLTTEWWYSWNSLFLMYMYDLLINLTLVIWTLIVLILVIDLVIWYSSNQSRWILCSSS